LSVGLTLPIHHFSSSGPSSQASGFEYRRKQFPAYSGGMTKELLSMLEIPDAVRDLWLKPIILAIQEAEIRSFAF
jgi:hypothetical protein